MDFSKLETEVISYDVRRLIDELLFSLKAQARFKEISVGVEYTGDISDIEIDVGQLQQVLMNLLNNAADALEERYKKESSSGNADFVKKIGIHVTREPELSMVNIAITDNGCGIPEQNLSKVFQLHFTTKKSGHGLGLANCRKIVKNHNGDITLTSREGEGTTFNIVLPERQTQTTE
jgi:signal transduction histidine kinase